VEPADSLASATLDLAITIARQPSFSLKTAKMAVNAAEDAQGRQSAKNTAFALHQLAHSHWLEVSGVPVDLSGVHQSVSRHFTPGEVPWSQTRDKKT
jgi:enoyl-CoA hydratase